jgi:hypothetical protein
MVKPAFLVRLLRAALSPYSAETGDRESTRKRTIEIAERESLLSELEIVRGCSFAGSEPPNAGPCPFGDE